MIRCFFRACSMLSIHCTIMTLYIRMAGRKSPVACHGGTETTMQGLQPALAQSGRQSLFQPRAGFGKPCWIAHFVCGIRAGAKLLHLLIPQLPACQRPGKAQPCGATCMRNRIKYNIVGCFHYNTMFYIIVLIREHGQYSVTELPVEWLNVYQKSQ